MNQSRQLAAIMLAYRSFSIGGFTDIIGYTVLKSKKLCKSALPGTAKQRNPKTTGREAQWQIDVYVRYLYMLFLI